MSGANKAVFLSYASQDAEAARRICEALRAGGVEVWFDADGGLEHGDEWDAKIRRQIKECVLFIPIISANTQAREEGYFRIEWELAAQRALGIASGVAFILPVVIDDTKEPAALVPDRFRSVQWTRLRNGEVPPEVQQRFLKLWSHRTGVIQHEAGKAGAVPVDASSAAEAVVGKPNTRTYALIALAVAFIVGGIGWWIFGGREPSVAPPSVPAVTITPTKPAPAPAPLSEARQLVEKARALFEAVECTRDDYKLAEELIMQAKAKDPLDAEVSAIEAQLHGRFLSRGWDVSDARREAARAATQRAIRLDPQSFEARVAQAGLLGDSGDATEKERQLRELRRERPADKRVLRMLASVLERAERVDEAAAIADESAALPGGDPVALYSKSLGFWFAGRTAEAETAIQESMAQQPFAGARLLAAWYRITLHGDLEGARGFFSRIAPAELIEDRAAFFAFYLEFLAHRPDAAIARLQAVPRDWLNDFWYRGPKGRLVGDALEMAGRHDAALLEWTAALKLVEQRLAASPSNVALIYNRTSLLVRLGRREEADRQLAVLRQMQTAIDISSSGAVAKSYALFGQKAEAIAAIAVGLKNRNHAVAFPSGVLRLDPIYDSLRGEPEFAKLIEEAEALERATSAAAPKTDVTTAFPTKADLSAVALAKVDDKSVAVLAFANLSDDKSNEYFSDGISEELLNVLAKIPGLKVSARTSAFYFKGKEVPIPEIAKQLGVAYVVEGSVRKAGDKVRITAQLIKAADGFHVWSDTFTRDLKDVFAVQDEIAGLIAKNLELKMGMVAARPTVDLEAYQEYLTGKALFAKATMPDLREAVTHLERAVAIDPKFAAAWVQLASTHTRLGRWGGVPTRLAWPAARAAIDKARALEPDSPDMLVALGWILRTAEWDWRGAEQAFRRALELRPNHAETLAGAAVLLFNVGKEAEAFRLGQQAAQLDPLNAGPHIDLSLMFYFNRNWVESERSARRALQLAPDGASYHSVLGWSLMEQKRYAEAEKEIALEPDAVERVTALGLLAIARNQTAAARQCLDQLETIARTNRDAADLQTSIAWLSAGLGDKERAFAALEHSRASRDPSVSWFRNGHYLLSEMYSDPRWGALLRKVGLADDQLK